MNPRAPLPPRVGDVYCRGLDVRRVGELGVGRMEGRVWYHRPRGYEIYRGAHRGRWMKLSTWLRWAARADLIEQGGLEARLREAARSGEKS